MSRFEQFTLSVFCITHYWNKIATEKMKEYHLKGTYGFYLILLAGAEENMTAARLSELTLRDKADISRAVAQFQKQGLVKIDETRRYRAPIVLTEKGRRLAEQIQIEANKALEIAGAGLSESMRADMYQSLFIISSNLKRLCEDRER